MEFLRLRLIELSKHPLKHLYWPLVLFTCPICFFPPKRAWTQPSSTIKNTVEFPPFEEIAEINKSEGQKMNLTWANLLLWLWQTQCITNGNAYLTAFGIKIIYSLVYLCTNTHVNACAWAISLQVKWPVHSSNVLFQDLIIHWYTLCKQMDREGFLPCYWMNFLLSSHPSRLQHCHYHFISRNKGLLIPAVFVTRVKAHN